VPRNKNGESRSPRRSLPPGRVQHKHYTAKPAHPLVETIPAGPDGWTAWQNPIMKGYVMQCCGCGLKHEAEFRVFKVDERVGTDENYGPIMPPDDYRVQMRMKRHD
jgi:hypothetical protein